MHKEKIWVFLFCEYIFYILIFKICVNFNLNTLVGQGKKWVFLLCENVFYFLKYVLILLE